MATKTKSKRGRPKGKPVSDAELRQRLNNASTAAWKHGQYATGLASFVPPCREKNCPLDEFPCDIRRQRDEAGQLTRHCVLHLLDPRGQEMFAQARSGNHALYHEWIDGMMGGLARLFEHELQSLHAEGAAIPIYARTKTGQIRTKTVDGEKVPVVLRFEENPRADFVIHLGKQLGATGKEQLLTPLSRDTKETNASLRDALDLITKMGATK